MRTHFQVKSIHIHSNFSMTSLESDIAILILNSPTEYTDLVRPICLWDRNQIELKYVEGQEGTVRANRFILTNCNRRDQFS